MIITIVVALNVMIQSSKYVDQLIDESARLGSFSCD